MKKAQISLEFILAVGFILIFGTLVILYGYEKQNDIASLGRYVDLKEECTKAANLAHSVFVLGDGTKFSSQAIHNTTFFHKIVQTIEKNGTDFTCINQIYVPQKFQIEGGTNMSIKNDEGRIIVQ